MHAGQRLAPGIDQRHAILFGGPVRTAPASGGIRNCLPICHVLLCEADRRVGVAKARDLAPDHSIEPARIGAASRRRRLRRSAVCVAARLAAPRGDSDGSPKASTVEEALLPITPAGERKVVSASDKGRYPKLIWRQPPDDHKWFACFGRGVQHPVLELVQWFIWRAHKPQLARRGVQHIGQATANHDQCWLGTAARRQAG